jgi:predicted TIM-barrel fold metal-dependent hydrolase
VTASPLAPFRDLLGLAELPWFARGDEGRLVVRDRSFGPVLDVHTHVALAYVMPIQVDVFKETPETLHYLPGCRPLDLELYANRNFQPGDITEMKRDLSLRSMGPHGMRATHTAPNLVREMDEMGITRSVLLPIDFPVLSHNAETALEVARENDRIVGFGSVHPWSRGLARRLDAQIARGARGIKVHPAVQCVRPDDARAIHLYRLCGERGIPVLWHCGPVGIAPRLGEYLTQVRFYEKPIAECPRTTFILGHAGALQLDLGVALQKRYPNVWLETASQSLPGVRTIVERADTSRVLMGSDWPFYHQAISLSKVLLATEGRPEVRHAILWGNAARLLRIES